MRIHSFALVAVAALAATGLHAQPLTQATCNGQTCTFTLSFDDQYEYLTNTTAAPFSGQRQNGNSQTLPNGTHTSNLFTGPMIYRDSKGRVRTERHAYNPPPQGLPANPNDFIIAEIHDSVAGFEYVLDPVNRVAHRRAYKPEQSWKWDPSRVTNTQTTCGQAGPKATVQILGTQTISGVTAYGCRITSSRTLPEGAVITSISEEWRDPVSGEMLSRIDTTNGNSQTLSYANYSNSEPAPSLFQVPDGYQTVDETEPVQVVHNQIGPGVSGSGMQGPQLRSNCEEGVCEFTFDPGNAPASFAVTGAPYSGHQILTSVTDNGKPYTGLPNGRGEYRDSFGRVRMDPMGNSDNGPAGPGLWVPPLVEIDDPIAGYRYVLDPASQTAYRLKASFRSFAFQPNPNMGQQVGTRTAPRGDTITVENLGPETISGVSAVGQRTTDTYPPGTYNNNDKTIVMVNEQWLDPKTGIMILAKNAGLRTDSTRSIPDYKEGDPDPTLFLIPASYKIVDETGKFSFSVPAVKQ